MIRLRSIVFNTLFYANLILRMIILAPYYFVVPRKRAYRIPKNWAKSSTWLMEKIVGTTFEIEGLENIPDGGYILSPKHQSFWDTFALLPYLNDPVYILKRELMWIPLFGWYAAKQKMIPVNRGARGKVMAGVMSQTKDEMRNGRQLIIYPEGTRRPPGADPVYKYGIARLYRDLDVPVVPVVMHPGLFWPRRTTLRFPGHFRVRILPPIMPGMDPDAFFDKLLADMETASDELLIETVRNNPDLPVPASAETRLKALGAGDLVHKRR
ncbi:lysophospholipid acyltransferase family protein [Rhizobium halophytocola]|uniref:1-acyl-sn-glycerol-3-phosphate acyltransferase n=1 Tax=Rhizobium halophytocola TaxID=735519 RepID=A0ABS4E2L7_9HYPH|nr:lysophospholipid acyltransferase family protein [Rhizobium halophytocola]MBP1852177.1 1-acyl-sn-glycerol-3-phosphate acyltransferase [Rhizobium halophytocola]